MEYAVIYLHGFLSSPASVKAQQAKDFVSRNFKDLTFEVPKLANYPDEARDAVELLVEKHKDKKLRFIGSSMGGYLSTYCIETFGGKGVLINPAVKPYELLADYLGEHTNPYTNEKFVLQPKHVDFLLSMDYSHISFPQKYWVLLQTGDETLDYRQAEEKYAGGKLTIEEGGDHSFQDFQRFLPDIFEFLMDD